MENKQHHSSGFLNGFVIGMVVGVGIALLFSTKKGKRILKSLSEEGLDKVTNFEELMQKFERVTKKAVESKEYIEDKIEGEDYIPHRNVLIAESVDSTPKTVAMPAIQINTTGEKAGLSQAGNELTEALKKLDEEAIEEDEPAPKVKPTRRRFFRGIPKRG